MDKPQQEELTPMFRQYEQQKAQHGDAVLFFRMGDFYEMFRSDAVEVSRLLNLTLTQRQGIPMCGVPYHAAGNYIARLLKLGRKIAICEQVELPADGKGLARREVVEVVTPGTVIDDAYLDERSNNYLAALAESGGKSAFAYIDLSTGEFCATLLNPQGPTESLRRELAKTSPREIIVQGSLLESPCFSFLNDEEIVINRLPDWSFDKTESEHRLKRQFNTINLKAFGLEGKDMRSVVAAAILEYIEENHKNILPHIQTISCYDETDTVGLDESTIRNLELVRNLQDGGSSYTLLETLDHSKTSGGARYLRKRLLQPFPKAQDASEFHQRVEKLYRDQRTLSALRKILGGMGDIERLASCAALDRAHAKNLVSVRHTLEKAQNIKDLLDNKLWDTDLTLLNELFERSGKLAVFLASSLMDDPSILLTEGRLIRESWDEEVDRMRLVRDKGHQMLDDYIREERAATGLSSLKVKHNRILGHFIEISKNHSTKVPERFRRRQSLTQVDRFSTERLEELQSEIASVAERLIERERELFLQIREKVKNHVSDMLELGRLLSDIDILQTFAHAATEYGYVRPKMCDTPVLDIKGGRHPVVERHLPHGSFVPNPIHLGGDDQSFALVTGPNMAGKSTVLRQVALITLMAQAGSFVPADEALIGTADRIFCRVGASDNLARGESTFLVEMNETANILRNATSRSLVIMDEVGRGTGTADGLAIARAVSEYLLGHQAPRTLFATHYRELTRIEHENLRNLSMSVEEKGDSVVFTRHLIEGPAESSYGIHVASLAGLPETVVERSRALLKMNPDTQPSDVPKESHTPQQLFLFKPEDLILDALRMLNLDTLTPIEALNTLSRWQSELDNM